METNQSFFGKFGQDVLYTFSTKIISTFLMLIITVWTARLLGPEGQGVYALTMFVPSTLNKFLNLGLPTSNIIFLSRNELSLKGAYLSLNKFFLPFFIFTWICLLLLGLGFGSSIYPLIPFHLLIISLLILIPMTFSDFYFSFFWGKAHFKAKSRLSLLQPLTLIICLMPFLLFDKLNINLVIYINLLSYVSYASFSWWYTKKLLLQESNAEPQVLNLQTPEVDMSTQLKLSMKLYFVSIIGFLNLRSDLYLVGLLTDISMTGIYSIAIQISERLLMVPQSINSVLLPKLGNLLDNEKEQVKISTGIARWNLIFSLLSTLIILCFLTLFVEITFGSDFKAAIPITGILLLATSIKSYTGTISAGLNALKKPEIVAYVNAVTLLINITLNLTWIPEHGIKGAAWATVFAYLSNLLGKVYFYIKLYKINPILLIKPELEVLLIHRFKIKK